MISFFSAIAVLILGSDINASCGQLRREKMKQDELL